MKIEIIGKNTITLKNVDLDFGKILSVTMMAQLTKSIIEVF